MQPAGHRGAMPAAGMRPPLSPRALTLAAALAATALVLLLWHPAGAPTLPPEVDAPAPADAAATQGEPAAAADGDGRFEDDAGDGDPAFGDDDPGRESVAGDGDGGDATEGPLVTVLRGEPAAPVPFVEVAWVDRDVGRERQQALPAAQRLGMDWRDHPHRFGQRARTGANGTLRLPPLRDRAVVAVAHEGEFAVAITRGRRDVVLHLVRDETLRVTVIGDDGRGRAGVPVGVGWTADRENGRIMARSITDAHGIAELRHFQTQRPGPQPNERFAAAVLAPLDEPSFTEFDGRPAPEQPIALRLPPTTPLDVTVEHASGAPVLQALPLSLQPEPDDDTPATADLERLLGKHHDALTGTTPLGTAPLRFPHLGRGLSLRTAIRLPGTRGSVQLPTQTPIETEGRAELRLVLPTDLLVLALCVTDGDGAPIGSDAVDATLAGPGSQPVAMRFATLADGRSDAVLRSRQLGDTGPWTVVLRHQRDDGTAVGASVQLSPLRPGERRDLGTVALRPDPRIAYGTVTDDLDEPLAGAAVTVQLLLETPRGERWHDDPLLRVPTDASGAFAIHGTPPATPFRLAARKSAGWFPDSTAALPIGAEVRLRLQRSGTFTGRVLLPEWLGGIGARVVFEPQQDADDERRRRQHTADLSRNGRFTLSNLQPGDYTAAVTLRNLPDPIGAVAGVRVAPGTDNRDPRLDPLDLQQALFRYRLRAVGPGGQHLADLDGPILWHTRRPAGEQATAAFRWSSGRAEFVLPEPFVSLTTLAKGFPPTPLSLTAGDHDVVLQPVQPFRVELPGVRALAGAERAIRVSAIFTGDTGLPQGLSGEDQRSGKRYAFARWELGKSGGGWLDAADAALLELSRGGPHQIVLRLYEGAEQKGRQASIDLGTIEVAVDGSQGRATVVGVDPQRLLDAVAQLAPQQGNQPGGGR